MLQMQSMRIKSTIHVSQKWFRCHVRSQEETISKTPCLFLFSSKETAIRLFSFRNKHFSYNWWQYEVKSAWNRKTIWNISLQISDPLRHHRWFILKSVSETAYSATVFTESPICEVYKYKLIYIYFVSVVRENVFMSKIMMLLLSISYSDKICLVRVHFYRIKRSLDFCDKLCGFTSYSLTFTNKFLIPTD